MIPANKRPVEVEDLLRLKRAERPLSEFWSEFDRALRAKQLSALVDKRPWWQTLPRAFAGWRRWHVPIGATAVAALAFFTLRENDNQATAPEAASEPVSRMAVAAPVAPSAPTSVGVADVRQAAVADLGHSSRLNDLVVNAQAVAAQHNATPIAEIPARRELVPATSFLVASSDESLRSTRKTSPESSGVSTLQVASISERASARNSLIGGKGFETRVATSRSAVEPLQQMAPPGERMRAKLHAAIVATNTGNAPTRSTERTANRLSEEQLYDQVHRFGTYGGAGGAGVSMKF